MQHVWGIDADVSGPRSEFQDASRCTTANIGDACHHVLVQGNERTDEPSRLVDRRSVLSLGVAAAVVFCAGCSDDARTTDALPEPPPRAFGTKIDAGSLDTVQAAIRSTRWFYVPEARTYLVAYPHEKVSSAKAVYPKTLHQGLDAGLLALFQRCTHLGCRVPVCSTSGMLECPCHNGIFSAVGEWRSGPPPRGLDLFPIEVRHGRVLIDTKQPVMGLDKSIDVSSQSAEGPHCI